MKLGYDHVACVLTCLLIDHVLDFVNWRAGNRREHPRYVPDDMSSSVWCRGPSHVMRTCIFKNLYYRGDTGDFVFLHGAGTTLVGDLNGRNDPALTDLSSVSDHGAFFFKFVDLPESAISQFPVVVVHTETLVMSRFNPDNLMHVLHDDLIPIFSTVREVRSCSSSEEIQSCLNNLTLFLTDKRPKGPYWQLYRTLVKNQILRSGDMREWYRFTRAIVGLRKDSTWYQYGFTVPQGPLYARTKTAGSEVRAFVQFFLNALQVPVTSQTNNRRALIISRTKNRLIMNIDELAHMVQAHTELEPLVIDLESEPLQSVVTVLRETRLLIAMHGSALILLMFMQPGSAVLELFPYGINPDNYTPYKTLANLPAMNIAYAAWQNTDKQNAVFHPEYEPHFGGIHHLPLEAQERILQVEEVPPHLCCENPDWLFHIYQDTAVDTSIVPLLNKLTARHIDEESNSLQPNMFPGPVVDLKCEICHLFKESKQLTVSWVQPWNIVYVGFKQCWYEVWLQGGGGVEKHETNSTLFVKNTTESAFYVWVKAVCNEHSGSFNAVPPNCENTTP